MKRRFLYVILSLFLILAFVNCKGSKEDVETQGELTPAPRVSSPQPILLEPPAKTSPPPEQPSPPPATPMTEGKEARDQKPETPAAPQVATGGKISAIPAPELGEPQKTPAAEIERVPFKPKVLDTKSNIDILIDTSGSMDGLLTGSSLTKFISLIDSLLTVLGDAASDPEHPRNIGIRSFGGKCSESNDIYPIGELNMVQLSESIMKLSPDGESSIVDAIKASYDDFPKDMSGDKIILLIADGGDSCKKDACNLITDWLKDKKDILIEVIGFDLDEENQRELKCIASASGGKFWLARDASELYSNIEESLNSGIPYNLKLKVKNGASPLPSKITILKSGTGEIVDEATTLGIRHFSLPPGSYDLRIEYLDSKEKTPPAKIVKGVEIQEGTKIAQEVEFGLAPLTLKAVDENDGLIPSKFEVFKAGTEEIVISVDQLDELQSTLLSPGKYDIKAYRTDEPSQYTVQLKDVEISPTESTVQLFYFQPGMLNISGISSNNQPTPFTATILTTTLPPEEVMTFEVSKEGTQVELQPGKYEIRMEGLDETIPIPPLTQQTIEILPAKSTDVKAEFTLIEAKFLAIDTKKNKLPARFTITTATGEAQTPLATIESKNGDPILTSLPPGDYNVIIEITRSKNDPLPSETVSDLKFTKPQPKPIEIKGTFSLGMIRVRGIDSKERPVESEFDVYIAGGDELVAKQEPGEDWAIFDLPPGTYDIKGIKFKAKTPRKPTVVVKDIKIEESKTVSLDAMFTTGKIKLMGRGANNIIITTQFKIFEYGSDTELINGTTGDDWQIYDIEPGKYYLEVSYHDAALAVTLKKWINIEIGENEVLEKVLRF
ncbi:MAG: VWA domain-containing protein [Pseudomonadota bacterium]